MLPRPHRRLERCRHPAPERREGKPSIPTRHLRPASSESAYADQVRRRVALAVALVLTGVETIVVARRRGRLIGANTIVRCRDGHLFTTLWIPGASLKAIRLGWWRLQRCPVGNHWSLVTPVQASTLTADETQVAAQRHDLRIP